MLCLQKGKVKRLEDNMKNKASSSICTTKDECTISQRNMTSSINWKLCIFCQTFKPKEKPRSIATFHLSNRILENAAYDQKLRIHLAGVSDLIAAEGIYHLQCLVKFNRAAEHVQEKVSDGNDLALVWLSQELRIAAEKGHVFELSEIWKRYCDIARTSNISIPASFDSRRSTFKDKLIFYVGDVMQFIPSLRYGSSECRTLAAPVHYSHLPLVELIKTGEDDSLTMPT